MNNITVGESALKVVVPKPKKGKLSVYYEPNGTMARMQGEIGGHNDCIDKTLSTPLPPVEDCVFINSKGELEWKRL